MTVIKTNVTAKTNDEIVSADVDLYNSNDEVVRTVTITDADTINTLINEIESLKKEIKRIGDIMKDKEKEEFEKRIKKVEDTVNNLAVQSAEQEKTVKKLAVQSVEQEEALKKLQYTENGGYYLKIGRKRNNVVDGLDGSQLHLSKGDSAVFRLYNTRNEFFEKNSSDGKRYVHVDFESVFRLEFVEKQETDAKGNIVKYLEAELKITRSDTVRRQMIAWCKRNTSKTLERNIIEEKAILLNNASW